jgi:hypothetical protein
VEHVLFVLGLVILVATKECLIAHREGDFIEWDAMDCGVTVQASNIARVSKVALSCHISTRYSQFPHKRRVNYLLSADVQVSCIEGLSSSGWNFVYIGGSLYGVQEFGLSCMSRRLNIGIMYTVSEYSDDMRTRRFT